MRFVRFDLFLYPTGSIRLQNGNATKPFLLPQENPGDYYTESLYSFNVPEFINGTVKLNLPQIEKQLISKKRK
jgi:hypothetical protein